MMVAVVAAAAVVVVVVDEAETASDMSLMEHAERMSGPWMV